MFKLRSTFGLLLALLMISSTLLSAGPRVSGVSTIEPEYSVKLTSVSLVYNALTSVFLLPDNTFKPNIGFMGFIVLSDSKYDNRPINGILREQERQKKRALLI